MIRILSGGVKRKITEGSYPSNSGFDSRPRFKKAIRNLARYERRLRKARSDLIPIIDALTQKNDDLWGDV